MLKEVRVFGANRKGESIGELTCQGFSFQDIERVKCPSAQPQDIQPGPGGVDRHFLAVTREHWP